MHLRKPARTVAAMAGGPSRRDIFAIAAVLAAMVLVVLDAAIANIALPTIAQSLHVTPAMSVWVITAYQTGLLMALLPCAALGESVGYRRVFAWGVGVFTVASVLCALAPTLPWLVAARLLQGFGGAAVMALGVALLRAIVPQERLGAAIGWNALAIALAAAAGPAVGAAILSATTWPWLFALNLPLGVLVLAATRALPNTGGTGLQLDFFSATLSVVAFALLVIGAEMLTSNLTLATLLLATAGLAIALLVRRESPKKVPLIPLDLLRINAFRVSVIASICCFAGQTAGMVALPFYLHYGLGQNTLNVGLYMIAWPLTVAVAAPFAGRLADRVSTARLCAAGSASLAVGLAAAAVLPLQNTPLMLVPLTMLCGLGFALFNVANNRSIFLSAPAARSGAAGGMQATARLIGQTAGAVIMTLLFTVTAAASNDIAPRIGLGIAAALTLTAGVVSLLRASSVATKARSK